MAPKLMCMLEVRHVYLLVNNCLEDSFTNDSYWNRLKVFRGWRLWLGILVVL